MTICYSCAMPLQEEVTSDFDENYCIHCQNQETGQFRTYEEVRQGSIDAAMRLMGKNETEAHQLADQILPNLPHWKKQAAERNNH